MLGKERRERELHSATLRKYEAEIAQLNTRPTWYSQWHEVMTAAIASILTLIGTLIGNHLGQQDLDETKKALREMTESLRSTKTQLDAQIDELQRSYASYVDKTKGANPQASEQANDAIIGAAQPAEIAKVPPASEVGRSEAIEGLFSPSARVRLDAYDRLMKNFGADPTLPHALIEYARAHLENPNGIYNTLVVLGHMNRTALQASNVAEIHAFADGVRGKGPRIAERVTKLQQRLETR